MGQILVRNIRLGPSPCARAASGMVACNLQFAISLSRPKLCTYFNLYLLSLHSAVYVCNESIALLTRIM